jgi:tRNA A-37 threonylcarbamoyl transferase component Bud32
MMQERLLSCGDPRTAGGFRGVRAWFGADATDLDLPAELSRSNSECLEALFALSPDSWLRRVPGRETFAWPGDVRWIVKRVVGGEPRDYWYERLRGRTRSPARREAENLQRLAADGLAVPRVLAWFEEPAARRHPRLAGRRGRSVLVMERARHTETLRGRLQRASPAERRAWLARLADYVTRLHKGGWYHRDLYLQHFVLVESEQAEEGRLVLLDVGRARREAAPRRRWFVKDLAALLHSAPACVTRSERLRFLRAWLLGLGSGLGSGIGARLGTTPRADGSEARPWVTAVTAKERRIAAHEPRLVDRTVPLQVERPPA